jgi:hypothetical protein
LQLIQKALVEMNLQLQNVVSDISGDTGMRIVRAICAGERDAKLLAKYRDPRCKNSEKTIEKSLNGHYKTEVLFCLQQALEIYDHYQAQINQCNKAVEALMQEFEDQSEKAPPPKKKREAKKNNVGFDLQGDLWRALGVNLMEIPGMNTKTALVFISEVGTSVDRWANAKHFASWLGLCPNNRISGGKKLSGRTGPSSNRLRNALRMAALTLERSQTALGAFYRRMKARLGAPKAIVAAAHKLAVVIYNVIKHKTCYQEKGPLYFEKEYKDRTERRLKRMADRLGYVLTPKEQENQEGVLC